MTSRTWATWIAATSLNTPRTSARSCAVDTPCSDGARAPGCDSITWSNAAPTESEWARRCGRPAGDAARDVVGAAGGVGVVGAAGEDATAGDDGAAGGVAA